MRLITTLLLVLLYTSSLLSANALFTSSNAGGDWNVSATWVSCGSRIGQVSNTCAVSGTPTCHVNIPCAGDGVDAGDEVLIGAGQLHIPAGYAASVGAYRTSADVTPAIGVAGGYSAANASLLIDGALKFAGKIYQNISTWTVNGNGAVWTWTTTGDASPQLVHDTTFAAAPATTSYGWIQNVDFTNSTASILNLTGTPSHSITIASTGGSKFGGFNQGTGCPSGTCLNKNGGFVAANYVHFLAAGLWYMDMTGSITPFCFDCTWDANSGGPDANLGGLSAMSINMNGTGSFSCTGCFFNDPAARAATLLNNNVSATAPQIRFQHTVFYGTTGNHARLYAYGGSNANQFFTLFNVLFDGSALTDGGGLGNVIGSLTVMRTTTDTNQTIAGVWNSSSIVRLVNSSMTNMHPIYMPMGVNTAAQSYTGFTFDGNADNFSDWFEPINPVSPASRSTTTVQNNILMCSSNGAGAGSFINIDPEAVFANQSWAVSNNTYCSSGLITDVAVYGVGFEGQVNYTQPAATISSLSNNVAYRLDTTAFVPLVCVDNTHVIPAAGWITLWQSNALFSNNSAQTYCNSFTLASIGTGPLNDVATTALPPFGDTQRRLMTFGVKYFNFYPGCAAWTNGNTYNAGDVVCDTQSSQFNNTATAWRAIAGNVAASATNRPLTGSAWLAAWEPADLAIIRTSILSGTVYTDGAPGSGVSNVGIVQLLNAWERTGYTLLTPTYWCGDANGQSYGAVAFCAPGKAMIGAVAGL